MFTLQPTFDGFLALLALAAMVGFVSGLRPFATAFWLGLAGCLQPEWLPAGLQFLSGPLALMACGVLALAERLADSLALRGGDEDLLLASLRVPVGAMLTAGLLLEVFGAWGWMGLPIGAALAASGQALKAALRAMCGLLPQWGLQQIIPLVLDVALPALMLLAWYRPAIGLGALGLTLLVALPAAIWWARELRSRWRRWAAAGHGSTG